MSGASLKVFLLVSLLVSGILCGGTLPTRILILADAVEHMTNLVDAVASHFDTTTLISSFSDNIAVNGGPGGSCYLCNPIPSSYAIVIWQTETNFESSPDWSLIRTNIEDFVNSGRIVLITGESLLENNGPEMLEVIGAVEAVHIAATPTGTSGSFTDYPECDPLLQGFFGDLRSNNPSPGSYPGAQEDQINVDVTIAGAGLSNCWEITYPEIAAGGRFTSAQRSLGGFLVYMQCDGTTDYNQFLTGFYNVIYNNVIDYSLQLFAGGLGVPPIIYKNILLVSTLPIEQVGSPINGIFPELFVPLVDVYASEDIDASVLLSPIPGTYDVLILVLFNSDYSASVNFATYAANVQAFADAGGLVVFYGADPEITSDPGWIPLLGGSGSALDTSGLSNQFGNFANCGKILNGFFGSFVGLNPNNLDLPLASRFHGELDTLVVGSATPCLQTQNAGHAVISYINAANGGLIVYLTSAATGDPSDNFQDITVDWYRSVYNNLYTNFFGLTGGAGGDPHIFTFGGDKIELAFESGKHYVFYGSHDFSIVIGTIGYTNTIYIAEIGITMGTHRFEATQLATRPIFKLNGEIITDSVHTPLGLAEVFVPERSDLNGALSEMAPYVSTGIRIGDQIEIVGGLYEPFIFYNIEIFRASQATEFGLLHAARHQQKRDVDFLKQYETATLF